MSTLAYNEIDDYNKVVRTDTTIVHPATRVTTRKRLDPEALALAKSEDKDVLFEAVGKAGDRIGVAAHRSVLANESEVFDAMFFGPLLGDWKYKKVLVVKVEDAEAEVFNELIKYVYRKEVDLTEDNTLHLLYLSNKYMMRELMDICQEYLETSLDPDNFCIVFDGCLLLNDREFEERLLIYYRLNAPSILVCNSFLKMSREALQKLMELDAVNVKELDLFKACHRWSMERFNRIRTEESLGKEILQMFGDTSMKLTSSNPFVLRGILGEKIVRNIRFPAMSKKDFLSAMNVSCLLTQQETKSVKYAIDTGIAKDCLEFSKQQRKPFNEICASKADTKLTENNDLNETIFVPTDTVFITSVKVVPKKKFNRVLVELRQVKSKIELLSSTSGSLNDERLKFKRPVKVMKNKVYMMLIRYDQSVMVDCVIKRPTNQKRGPQMKDVFFFVCPKSSAISKLYYYVL